MSRVKLTDKIYVMTSLKRFAVSNPRYKQQVLLSLGLVSTIFVFACDSIATKSGLILLTSTVVLEKRRLSKAIHIKTVEVTGNHIVKLLKLCSVEREPHQLLDSFWSKSRKSWS